ncbi:hypothetical protein [Catenibacillus scindens]|uniref:hypothetical protein n=1 Tax=Catenibacillus scindens TaxID=673271 RepID=UPI003209F16F
MDILTRFFGFIPPEKPPILVSIFPQAAAQRIQSGKLPVIQADKIVLGKNEICHFVDVAALFTTKKRYRSSRHGGSYRITKGFTFHLGNSDTVALDEPEYTKGILYITNNRIIFVASRYGFDQRLNKLTAITPYSDGLTLQFGSKSYNLLLPDSETANNAINLLI